MDPNPSSSSLASHHGSGDCRGHRAHAERSLYCAAIFLRQSRAAAALERGVDLALSPFAADRACVARLAAAMLRREAWDRIAAFIRPLGYGHRGTCNAKTRLWWRMERNSIILHRCFWLRTPLCRRERISAALPMITTMQNFPWLRSPCDWGAMPGLRRVRAFRRE